MLFVAVRSKTASAKHPFLWDTKAELEDGTFDAEPFRNPVRVLEKGTEVSFPTDMS